MNSLAVKILSALVLCATTVAVTIAVIQKRDSAKTVQWYNHEQFRSSGGAPGGIVFNVGAKNYEVGIRSDGVVIVREYHDDNRLPEQIAAKSTTPTVHR